MLEDIIGRGALPSMIRVVTVVCAPAALQKLSTGFPGGLKKLAALCFRCLVCCCLMRSHAEEQPDSHHIIRGAVYCGVVCNVLMLRFDLCDLCVTCHTLSRVLRPASRPNFKAIRSLVGVPNQCTEVRGSVKGINRVLAAGLKVYAAMIDTELDERGYIVPGLGDAGDRAYNTL